MCGRGGEREGSRRRGRGGRGPYGQEKSEDSEPIVTSTALAQEKQAVWVLTRWHPAHPGTTGAAAHPSAWRAASAVANQCGRRSTSVALAV